MKAPTAAPANALPRKRKQTLWEEIKENKFFYIIAIPGILTMLLFNYLPMAGIYVAFEKYTYEGGLFGSEFVGLQNFREFFANWRYVFRATRNTLIINMGGVIFGTVVNVLVACVLGEVQNEKFRKFAQGSIILPHFLSWILVGVVSDTILNDKTGMLNQTIRLLGGKEVILAISPQYWQAIIIFFTIWKDFGYGSVVYYSALTGFDPGMYEAAKIDGANRWQSIMKITIPLLKPTIAIMFLLSVGNALGGSMDQIMGMTKLNPLILETTDTLATYVYRTTMGGAGSFGLSAVVSLYRSVIGFLLVMVSNWIVKRFNPDYALF